MIPRHYACEVDCGKHIALEQDLNYGEEHSYIVN